MKFKDFYKAWWFLYNHYEFRDKHYYYFLEKKGYIPIHPNDYDDLPLLDCEKTIEDFMDKNGKIDVEENSKMYKKACIKTWGKNYNSWESDFERCLNIEVVKINPKTEEIDNDDSKNTKIEIWLECGAKVWDEHCNDYISSYDYELDCGGSTFEKAIINLANLVYKKYGDKRFS